ncbi:carbonic anhydrase [Guyanagaster necrorhizus]|uniref:Carbonic anhydrase n=1 Tax=Guyanagaster necrorhizus TaxID=856835 RepID=A0A9P8AW16_9AGAR|nr:carbonic anhydrase [Guyanagaster necrorhizus MCA 3950]KAG7450154.1 carbonic anhydrase [Guyanagaster necrorhizus MCA 3950]
MFPLRIALSSTRPRHALYSATPTLFLNRYCSKTDKPESPSEKPIALPPKKRLAIVTCMDARINPFTQLGLEEGDAHIIRNAGGMAKDALRSIIISQRLLGTREIAVYHHTGCGMVTFTGPSLRRMLSDADPQNPQVTEQADEIDFLEFDDLEQSVRDDVMFLKESPLVMKGTKITGWVHYMETGQAVQVV